MSNRLRNKKINFWVTEEEKELIDKHIKNIGFENRSHFLRTVIFETNIIKTDLEPIRKLASEINSIGVNVNQIARIANQEKTVQESEITKILQAQENLQNLILQTMDIINKKKG